MSARKSDYQHGVLLASDQRQLTDQILDVVEDEGEAAVELVKALRLGRRLLAMCLGKTARRLPPGVFRRSNLPNPARGGNRARRGLPSRQAAPWTKARRTTHTDCRAKEDRKLDPPRRSPGEARRRRECAAVSQLGPAR